MSRTGPVLTAFADPAVKKEWFGDPDIEQNAPHVIDFRWAAARRWPATSPAAARRSATTLPARTSCEQGAYLDGLDTSAQREEGPRGLLDALATYLEKESS